MPIAEDQKTDSGELFQAKLNGNQEIVHKTASHSGRRGGNNSTTATPKTWKIT